MYCSKLKYWSKQGNFADLPLELSLHATHCVACSRFLAEVELARRWVEKTSVHRVSAQRLDDIEVLLRTEARPAKVGGHPAPRATGLRVGAAAAVLVLASAGAAAAWLAKHPPPAATVRQLSNYSPQVIVALAPGARGHADPHFPQSSYTLEAGEGEFDVGQFPGGRPFYVKGGDTTVSARGAHFRVRVLAGRVEELHVMAGEVTLDIPGEQPTVLGLGKSSEWSARPRSRGFVQPGQATDDTSKPDALREARALQAPQSTAMSETPRERTAQGRSVPDDTAFANAFAKLESGPAREAAVAFDGLISRGQLDPERRADVLYWSSQAHARAGNRLLAEKRAFAYVSTYPNGLHAPDAALLLGDCARDKKHLELARRYYEKALSSGRSTTAARAKLSLSQLPR